MSLEIFRIALLKSFCALSIVFGLSYIVSALVNPKKFIHKNVKENKLKNESKFILSTRVLFSIIGIIFITTSLLFLLNKINKGDLAILFSITAILIQIGNLIISKKYLYN